MAIHPLAALKAAIRTRLEADSATRAFLAGAGILDELPRGGPAPFALFVEATARDRSSADARGHELLLGILFAARTGEGDAALAAAAHVEALLTEPDFTLVGHRLIALFVTETVTRRPTEREPLRLTLRLRALTEQL